MNLYSIFRLLFQYFEADNESIFNESVQKDKLLAIK